MNVKDLMKKGVDTEALGFQPGETRSDYFCTPRGASVFGWAGVDGIHFCTVKKFGGMIFAISPMNLPNDYVHPIARNFDDFLRLILAVGDTAVLEQAHGWSKERFDAFVKENLPTEEAVLALDQIAELTGFFPMENPYEYVKTLQNEFDYLSIPYKPDYAEWCPPPREKPEWKVFYGGGVHREGEKRRRAGTELSIGKTFSWGEETWLVPSVYLCSQGLVADICVMIDPERFAEYEAKWEFLSLAPLTREMREQAEEENPMYLSFHAIATVNGKPLREECGTGMGWIPDSCRPEGTKNDDDALWHLEHYGLDATKVWVFRRLSFPWATAKKPDLKTLSLTFSMEKARIFGEHLTVTQAGDVFTIRHPVSGAEHTLTVISYESSELPATLHDEEWESPVHFRIMEYLLTPSLSRAEFSLRDCEESDPPKRKKPVNMKFSPEVRGDGPLMIIGGADGPTAVLVASKSGGTEKKISSVVASSLHFEPREQTEFRVVFRIKTREDITAALLEKEETI